MPQSLASKTIAHIEQALEEGQSTAIQEIIQIIQELASRAFSISVPELSELIGRDPTITAKVISAANTLGFNPSGMPISTISEAIHTVGFEKIRNLAISIMLAENAGKQSNTYEQREMAALSVCSGMMAAALVQGKKQSIEPELAFVSASLRSYGKLLMSTFLLPQYRQAKALARETNSDQAFREVFGITPLSLGRRLLERARLPRSITSSLREITPDLLAKAAHTGEGALLLAAEFSREICEKTFDESIPPDQFGAALSETLDRFATSFRADLDTVNQALLQVHADMSHLNRVIGIADSASPATRKLAARVSGETLPSSPSSVHLAPPRKKKPFQDFSGAEREAFAEQSFREAEALITNKLMPGESVDLREIYQAACHTVMAGLDLANCMAFVREEFDPERLSARYGFGGLYAKIKNRPLVSPQNEDIFSICLARGEDIHIQDAQAGRIKSIIPEWISPNGETSSLLILPTKLGRKIHTILVGTVSDQRVIELEDGDLRRLRLIRQHLSQLRQMVEQGEITVR